MHENISKFQEIQLLLALIKHADEKGHIDFKKTDIAMDLSKIVWNGNWVDSLLYELNETKVLYYQEMGDEGFSPIIFARILPATYDYLASLIDSLNQEHEALKTRITDILKFDPDLLSKKIVATQSTLDEASKLVKGNELLKPIENQLNEIRLHFGSVHRVALNYEDIYKNIVRPVQEEGRSGIKATVKWAIISIILSTVISLVISNWSWISGLLAQNT